MRICFVTNFIPPYRKTFYEKLCATPGFEWLVVRGRVEGETGRPDYRGPLAVPVREVRNVEKPLGPLTLRWQAGALAAARGHRSEVLVLLGMVGNLSNWLLLAWARLTGRRVLVWACGWEPQKPGSWAYRLKQPAMRLFFGAADNCLLYSTNGKAYLAAAGVPAERLEVCFNGIEIDELLAQEGTIRAQAAALRSAHAPEGGFVFLYVGGLLAEKRVDMLIDSFAALAAGGVAAQLWIVGDGPEREALKQRAQAAGCAGIRFFGRIIEGVDAYFAAADVFVLPGLGGLAFNQAMFWGTPCIGSEADGTEDDLVIDGVTGFRFQAGDGASLSEAMRRAQALSPERRQALGRAARGVIVERSNVSAMVAMFVERLRALARA